jgi:transketolase
MSGMTETRFAYGEALLELGSQRKDVVVLDADLYKSTRTVLFRDAFPARFFDMGISELDMVSTAAGLASQGLVPFCNSFAIFITGVCYMPIRTQICYPSLPVKLVGSSAGLTEGPDGASHQSLEDIALMRILPHMVVLSPSDDLETRQCTRAAAEYPGPVYIRVSRYAVPRLHQDSFRFAIGKADTMREGGDVAVFTTGIMTWKAMEAAELLAKKGIAARVVNVATIKPLDEKAVRAAVEGVSLAVSVEEHSIIGGLGGALAECLSAQAGSPSLLRLGVRDVFGESGLADETLEKHGLQPAGIAKSIEGALKKVKK